MTYTGILETQVIVSLAFVLVWLLSLFGRKASYADVAWSLGFILAASVSIPAEPGPTRWKLLFGLTVVWALRLSVYVLWRNWGESEDRRYAEMRKYHGEKFWWVSLFTVFLLQSFLLGIVSMPLQAGIGWGDRSPLGPIDYLGITLWIIGMAFESVGDWQLARFKADPKNREHVMDRGLWRYTRHPNYFGEVCVWWGFYLIAAAGGAAWTIFSPLLMTFLLLKVSGVRLLEDTIGKRRPDYAEYQRRTSPFFPWPPKPAESSK